MTTSSFQRIFRFVAPITLAFPALVAGCASTNHGTHSSVQAETPKASAQGAADFQLPPGWTEADMQACTLAGMPGDQHKFLAQSAGTWTGTSTMWMAPETPPMTSPSNCTVTSEMDGRYTKHEYRGEIPGMGSFHGMGFCGFDNVSGKFVSTWLDNHSTGIMTGTGELGADGKTLTWTYKYNCPITKGVATMREIQRHPTNDTMTLEMHGTDPKTGKEFKMMQIDLKRTSNAKMGS